MNHLLKSLSFPMNWFWSNPWHSNIESQDSLELRLGILRALICLGACFAVFIQGEQALTANLEGPHFYYFDRVPWYFSLLKITHSYPVLELINFAVALISLILAGFGYRFRFYATLAIVSIFYLHGTRSSYNGNNHHVLITWTHALLILLFSRAGEVFSNGPSKQKSIEAWELIWPVRLLQLMLVIFYFSAGLAKFRSMGLAWLMDGSAIQRILFTRWELSRNIGDLSLFIAFHPSLAWFLSVSLVLIELLSPFLLVKSRFIRLSIVFSLVLFHFCTRLFTGVPFHFNAILLLVFVDFAPAFIRVKSLFLKSRL